MAILLGLDFETTGLDPATDHITEIGVCLWDTAAKTVVTSFSGLVHTPKELSEESRNLTGITDEQIDFWGHPIRPMMEQYCILSAHADYVVAHNANFEKGFLKALADKGVIPDIGKRWIDTKIDIPYRPGKGQGSLSEIAMAHGVFNPMPHRALPDVIAMMQVLAQYDFSEVERYALAPTKTLIIRVPFRDGEEARARVKSLGYYWNQAGKKWTRNFKEFQVADAIEAAAQAGFTAHLLEADTDEDPIGANWHSDFGGVQADNERAEKPALPL